jgi:hypothetical protein
MYCPQCGLRNSNSKICNSCGENLEHGKKYIRNTKFKLPIFYIILFAMGLVCFSGYFNRYYWPITIFSMLCLFLLALWPVNPDLNRVIGLKSSRFCPNCENTPFNKKYCIKCGYHIDDVLGYFKTYRNDIEMNKNYIRIYPKIYLEHNDGYPSRLSHITYKIDKIENIRLSSCESRFSNKNCLIFDYLDKKCKNSKKVGDICIVKVKIDDKDQYRINKLINAGYYDNIPLEL